MTDTRPPASPAVQGRCPAYGGVVTSDLPTVIHRTPEQLRAQRARLIASTGMSEDVLRERGEVFQLYPEHAAVWETVCDIDYLLSGAVDQ